MKTLQPGGVADGRVLLAGLPRELSCGQLRDSAVLWAGRNKLTVTCWPVTGVVQQGSSGHDSCQRLNTPIGIAPTEFV